MFAGFFIRFFFSVLLFLIASKKGYHKLTWAGIGFVLGPIALIIIFVYRQNANYSRAFLSGLTGVLIGAALMLVGWFLYPLFSPIKQAEMVATYADVFWVLILPTMSVLMGAVFFTVSLIKQR